MRYLIGFNIVCFVISCFYVLVLGSFDLEVKTQIKIIVGEVIGMALLSVGVALMVGV